MKKSTVDFGARITNSSSFVNMNSRDFWVSALAIVVVGGLGWWWYASNGPVPTFMGGMSTSTAATTTASAATSTASNEPQTINRGSDSVVTIAENIPGASRFAGYLRSTGVAAKLTGKGPYTIFVPTDGALSQLPAGTISSMSAAQLKRFVEYAIVSGRAIDDTALSVGSIQALSGDAINFTYQDNIPRVNNAIIITQYKAENGVVYLIGGVMLPPIPSQS